MAARAQASGAQPIRTFSSSLASSPLVLPRVAPVEQRLRASRPAIVAAAAPANQKIRIKLKSYWVDLLQDSVEKIKEAAATTGATIAGPVPLPTRSVTLNIWLLGPHVHGMQQSIMKTLSYRTPIRSAFIQGYSITLLPRDDVELTNLFYRCLQEAHLHRAPLPPCEQGLPGAV